MFAIRFSRQENFNWRFQNPIKNVQICKINKRRAVKNSVNVILFCVHELSPRFQQLNPMEKSAGAVL